MERSRGRDSLADTVRRASACRDRRTLPALPRFLPASHRHAHRLPAEDPDREGLRRRDRVAARPGADAVAAPRQSRAAEARGPAAGVLVQAARRLQQDGAPVAGRARARRDRRVGGQPRAGRRARGAAARLQGDDRDAGDHAAHQDRGGRGARRDGRAARRLLLATPTRRRCALQRSARRHVRASVRRSRRDRRAGHDRHGDPAPVPGPARRDLRRDRRRRPDRGHRRLREARAARRSGSIGVQPVDSDAMARSLAAGRRVDAAARGPVRRRRRGEAGRQGDVPPRARSTSTRWCRVDTDATCAAIKDVFEDTRSILEPAGALAVAGVKAWVRAAPRRRTARSSRSPAAPT